MLKLEQIGSFRVIRPAMQAFWRPRDPWAACDAWFTRTSGGEGEWTIHNPKVRNGQVIDIDGFRLLFQITDFGHIGVFPEQQKNWLALKSLCYGSKQPLKVLNIFAYTGGATIAAAMSGAEVVHVDASKTTLAWAKENALVSEIKAGRIRWILDDARKFVAREVRRGSIYQGIILDPPTFGRGPKGQVWKIEDHLRSLMFDLAALTDESLRFVLLTSHSPGFSPLVLENMIRDSVGVAGHYLSEEMVLTDVNGRLLPCGASCLFSRDFG